MKKKILYIITLLGIVFFGYSVNAATCTYDLNTPSKYLKDYCYLVCDSAYQNPKEGSAEYNENTRNRYYACTSWCSSYKAAQVDENCYCTYLNNQTVGTTCYKNAIVAAMENETWGKTSGTVQAEITNANNTSSMGTACKAIAGCMSGQNTAEIESYKATYNSCISQKITCDTPVTCANTLCKSDYKGSKFCKSGLTPTDYCNLKISSSKNASYSYGAGGNGTKGTISEDLDYIAKITVKNCYGFGDIVYYTSMTIKILQIVAPILLIIWASFDLFKSMIAGDEKKIIEMRKPIIQRVIAAMAIFLVPWVVSTIVDNFSSNADWLVCWKNNRFTYSGNEYNGSGYVNPTHDTSKEKQYITYACSEACSNSSIENCTKKCINMYWESSINCYTVKENTMDARTTCYNEFAKAAVPKLEK